MSFTSRALILFVFAVLGVSCAHATREQLARRASFDLDCAESQLEMVEIDSRTMGVRGCGKKAVYVEDCRQGAMAQGTAGQMQASTYEKDCTWVLNADTAKTAE
ncbi:MAG: hypothetical protein IT384_05060 [Deltaproteobacteria bacterium]|nr:hypothetical protein [Deltaproteobacteria bacterium]